MFLQNCCIPPGIIVLNVDEFHKLHVATGYLETAKTLLSINLVSTRAKVCLVDDV
jgi:hypothetical protein